MRPIRALTAVIMAAVPVVLAVPAQADDPPVTEGAITLAAQTFIDRQTRFGAMPTYTTPETPDAADLDRRVAVYGEMWDQNATLWEAATIPVQGRANIENSIRASLRLVPSFGFRPTRIAVGRNVVMYGAHNQTTVNGNRVDYPAIYRVVLNGKGDVRGPPANGPEPKPLTELAADANASACCPRTCRSRPLPPRSAIRSVPLVDSTPL
ncbi:hypothetical protein [Actinomadura rudentiformis]|uniref:Uncharacterized protein n=1 Tax=Actinomadura rudentiformis TaxID=359158 RepID=A0A6H9Y8T3_9ACTN|nr:hypothetical protein [Actinomadura rudentiformis]KAB2337805.1 hypothetical protein F8566_49425 [Actinomadura rudentiformis]